MWCNPYFVQGSRSTSYWGCLDTFRCSGAPFANRTVVGGSSVMRSPGIILRVASSSCVPRCHTALWCCRLVRKHTTAKVCQNDDAMLVHTHTLFVYTQRTRDQASGFIHKLLATIAERKIFADNDSAMYANSNLCPGFALQHTPEIQSPSHVRSRKSTFCTMPKLA